MDHNILAASLTEAAEVDMVHAPVKAVCARSRRRNESGAEVNLIAWAHRLKWQYEVTATPAEIIARVEGTKFVAVLVINSIVPIACTGIEHKH